jgi:hypothetical protein
MLVLFPVRSVSGQFRRMLEVYRESVTADGRIERLIREIELEAKPVTVVRNRSIKVVDEKLRGDPSNLRATANCHWRHLVPRLVSYAVSRAPSESIMLAVFIRLLTNQRALPDPEQQRFQLREMLRPKLGAPLAFDVPKNLMARGPHQAHRTRQDTRALPDSGSFFVTANVVSSATCIWFSGPA